MNSSPISRREVLQTAACGFGYLAFAGLNGQAASAYRSPLAARHGHLKPRAKRVIFMFMQGGPTHLETFDYKPELIANGGKNATIEYNGRALKGKLLAPKFNFKPAGKSGLMLSELFPHLSKHADDLCLLNGMNTANPAHPQATIMAHTGSFNFVRPSLGSWITYGLGTENENLPGFVTINPLQRLGGAQNYGSAFLPASFQGTRIAGNGSQMPNIRSSATESDQRKQLDFVQDMNRSMREAAGVHPELDGIIESYEMAYRMQTAVPEVVDLKTEPEAIKERYGITGKGGTANFGTQCLLARRLAESGVRFIQVNTNGWDQHNSISTKLKANCRGIDQPIAALMTDLKERGMLEETLIVWGGEFGRTPQGQNADGRRHNNRGYSMWMAGGGVKGGIRYGATDPLGGIAVKDTMDIHDLHATILYLLGLDHEQLTYRYAGRDFRLTDVYGNVAKDIVA